MTRRPRSARARDGHAALPVPGSDVIDSMSCFRACRHTLPRRGAFSGTGRGGPKIRGRELVESRLIADSATVVPSQPFTAGLLLKMAPGWHTYWQFAGDAGIPTELKWKLPPGWKAGPIQWPIPLKLNEPGDIQIFGYHDEVLLMMQLTPPEKIASSSVHLAAAANWLVCEKNLHPGSANLQLDLPVGPQPPPANTDLFAKYRDRLPRSLPSSAGSAFHWERTAKAFRLTITDKSLAREASVDFFPLPQGSTILGHVRREQTNDGRLSFLFPSTPHRRMCSRSMACSWRAITPFR